MRAGSFWPDMSSEVLFFTGINQIAISKTPRDGERFADRFYLTTDRNKIKSVIDIFRLSIGSVEYKYLSEKCSAFVYCIERIDTATPKMVGFNLSEHTNNNNIIVQLFMQSLWTIKDNAADQDRGWSIVQPGGLVNNNIIATRNTTAAGEYKSVEFTHEELKSARLLTQTSYVSQHLSDQPTQLVSSSLRFQRFMYFVQIARSIKDIPMKIAQYCSALEALVSSSTTELTHQVAERVACLLEA
jgi:hypothetical protein